MECICHFGRRKTSSFINFIIHWNIKTLLFIYSIYFGLYSIYIPPNFIINSLSSYLFFFFFLLRFHGRNLGTWKKILINLILRTSANFRFNNAVSAFFFYWLVFNFLFLEGDYILEAKLYSPIYGVLIHTHTRARECMWVWSYPTLKFNLLRAETK